MAGHKVRPQVSSPVGRRRPKKTTGHLGTNTGHKGMTGHKVKKGK